MEALKFRLSGRTAFFKKPDVNTFMYFSYGNIHKIALLGILGAITGLKGYSFQNNEEYPEFYGKLKDLKISIVPINERGYITKKVQVFNNSVGYASKEEGGNLIVKEQWLENPCWDIYVLLDEHPFAGIIKEHLISSSFKYIPYLGKNDHFANINNPEVINIDIINHCEKISSLYLKRYFNLSCSNINIFGDISEEEWKYEEKLPIGLEEKTNQYITESFVFTNMNIEKVLDCNLYAHNDKVLFFF